MAESTEPKPENKTEALARVETGVCGLVLHTLEDMKTVAQLILQSKWAPESYSTAEKIFVGLQTGAEIGLKPMQSLNSIVVIKGKPTLWGDAALALVKRSGLLLKYAEKVTGEGDDMVAFVESVRDEGGGRECVVETTFSVADAKTAKLWKKPGPWTTHPKRMLKYKARAFNLRDNFPDVLFGMHLTEEMTGEEPLPAPESDVLPRNERRSLAVPSSAVDGKRAPVQKETAKLTQESIDRIGTVVDGEVVSVDVKAEVKKSEPDDGLANAEADTVSGGMMAEEKANDPQEKPEVDAATIADFDSSKIGNDAHLLDHKGLAAAGLVTFKCNKCDRIYQYGKKEGKGVPCECGKGILVEAPKVDEDAKPKTFRGVPLVNESPLYAEPSEEKDDVKSLYVEVNGMYVAQNGQNFIEFAAYVLCIDDSEIAPSKLTEEQLKQIKAYIETSGVAIN